MINVDGIILMICCFKYKELRNKFRLKKDTYLNWRVIYLFGDPTINDDYIFENNTLTIKCEDSYLFLSKKINLGIKYVNQIFNIKEGIIKCDDDLIINEKKLIEFLNEKKNDYVGKNFLKRSIINPINIKLNEKNRTEFIKNYYKRHNDENVNSILQEKNLSINDLVYIPNISNFVALGHIYYISNKSIQLIQEQFEKINYDILTLDKKCNYFPYICEDISTGLILFRNNINLTHKQDLWYNPHYQNFDKPGEYLCFHTNEGNI